MQMKPYAGEPAEASPILCQEAYNLSQPVMVQRPSRGRGGDVAQFHAEVMAAQINRAMLISRKIDLNSSKLNRM